MPCLKSAPMAKRPNPRSIKAGRTYTIPEAAEALGVSIGSVRGWVRQGLPVLKSQRPHLILGDVLRYFLEARRAKVKLKLVEDQLYCLTCKTGQTPMGLMVDAVDQTTKTIRLIGLCSTCGGTCNRLASRAKLPLLSKIFDVACRDPQTP